MKYQEKNYTKFLIVYHLVLVVKYRKPLVQYFLDIAALSEFSSKELKVDRDHIHLLISSLPHLAPAQIVRHLKQENTRAIS